MSTFVAIDPSMNNWGYAKGRLIQGNKYTVDEIGLIRPKDTKSLSRFVNEQDALKVRSVVLQLRQLLTGIDYVFVEAPHGSQSAAAMKSYGMVIAVLGSLELLAGESVHVQFTRANDRRSVIYPEPMKGNVAIPKEDVIAWAEKKYPELPYPRKKDGSLISGKVEHIADALACMCFSLENTLNKEFVHECSIH